MSVTRAYKRAVSLMQQPGARLLLTLSRTTQSGRTWYIAPNGKAISDETAQALLDHPGIRPCDSGLFADQPQAWHLVHR